MSGARRVVVPRGVLVEGASGAVALPAEAAHYALRVLRLGEGDAVALLDGGGLLGRGRLVLESGEPAVALESAVEAVAAGESPLAVTVWCAIPKGDRWEWAVQKLTELGASRLVPLETQRSDVRLPSERVAARVERWQRIADEAARQCRRSRSMEVASPVGLEAALSGLGAASAGEVRLVGWAEGGGVSPSPLTAALSGRSLGSAVVAVGPEGGLTAGEVGRLVEGGGFAPVSLGPRVLRVETAAVALVTALQLMAGDLG